MEQSSSNIPSFDGANNTAGNKKYLIKVNFRFDQAIQSDHLQDLGQGGRQDCAFG